MWGEWSRGGGTERQREAWLYECSGTESVEAWMLPLVVCALAAGGVGKARRREWPMHQEELRLREREVAMGCNRRQ